MSIYQDLNNRVSKVPPFTLQRNTLITTRCRYVSGTFIRVYHICPYHSMCVNLKKSEDMSSKSWITTTIWH